MAGASVDWRTPLFICTCCVSLGQEGVNNKSIDGGMDVLHRNFTLSYILKASIAVLLSPSWIPRAVLLLPVMARHCTGFYNSKMTLQDKCHNYNQNARWCSRAFLMLAEWAIGAKVWSRLLMIYPAKAPFLHWHIRSTNVKATWMRGVGGVGGGGDSQSSSPCH